jgi:hypothetical protein
MRYLTFKEKMDSSVQRRAEGWSPRFDYRQKKDLSFLIDVQIISGAQPFSYLMVAIPYPQE